MNPNVSINIVNGTTYKCVKIKANGNVWSFLQASGLINYISIRKETNNPFKGAGKDFDSWASVENHYKTPEMHLAIFSAQTILAENQ